MVNFEFEDEYSGQLIAGIDEAGRGPLAGPVVAAAVIVDRNRLFEGVADSKKLSAKRRQELYDMIVQHYDYAVGVVGSEKIDEINILEATKLACTIAADSLAARPEIVLVDGNMKFPHTHYRSIVKGDDKSYSIAAASIVAKVYRDKLMQDLHQQHPHYSWERNAGYGTKAHLLAIKEHGLTKHHRKSFRMRLPE